MPKRPVGARMETERGAEALAATQSVADAARDVIERARAQRDELLVLASHDVKNAIGVLDSALGMLEESPEQGVMLHGMMRRATHRLGILVRAMVDVDLLQRGLMPLTPADVRWRTLAVPVVEAGLAVAATKHLALVPRGDQDAVVACDAALVEKVLAALVEHALANAPADSVVDVEGLRLEAGPFRIRVVHRGRATGAATLDKYFTTLPLRFARLAAIRHGATLRAVSPVEDGAGLAFELDLP